MTAEDSAEYERHSAECAKSRRRKRVHSVGKNRAEKETAFGNRRGVPGAKKGVFVTKSVATSYSEQNDGDVSTKLLW